MERKATATAIQRTALNVWSVHLVTTALEVLAATRSRVRSERIIQRLVGRRLLIVSLVSPILLVGEPQPGPSHVRLVELQPQGARAVLSVLQDTSATNM
jgi:hypothetical protein